MSDMKLLQLSGLILCCACFVSCETTSTTGRGNQETKRLAAIERERQQSEEVDERTRNLWNAQHDILTRDGNPATHYY
jgi:hypothetical protein